jgi:hypothetical protein
MEVLCLRPFVCSILLCILVSFYGTPLWCQCTCHLVMCNVVVVVSNSGIPMDVMVWLLVLWLCD